MAKREKHPSEKRHTWWREKFGQGYSLPIKHNYFMPFLKKLDSLNVLGKVIVDVGSGSLKMHDQGGAIKSGIFYPIKGKKIIRVDIGLPYSFKSKREISEIRADVEPTELDSFGQKRRLVRLAKFLGVNPKKDGPPVDSIIMSDVLNYVDSRKTISGLSRYLKPGGRIIILNHPKRGSSEYGSMFSKNGLKKNSELIDFLRESGFEIEHLTDAFASPESYPRIYYVLDDDFIILVARKNKKIQINQK